jgi:hypothetical protein
MQLQPHQFLSTTLSSLTLPMKLLQALVLVMVDPAMKAS